MTSRNWEAYVAGAVVELRRAKMREAGEELLRAPASRQAQVARACFRECANEIGKWCATWPRCKLLLAAMNELEIVEASARAHGLRPKKHAKGARL